MGAVIGVLNFVGLDIRPVPTVDFEDVKVIRLQRFGVNFTPIVEERDGVPFEVMRPYFSWRSLAASVVPLTIWRRLK